MGAEDQKPGMLPGSVLLPSEGARAAPAPPRWHSQSSGSPQPPAWVPKGMGPPVGVTAISTGLGNAAVPGAAAEPSCRLPLCKVKGCWANPQTSFGVLLGCHLPLLARPACTDGLHMDLRATEGLTQSRAAWGRAEITQPQCRLLALDARRKISLGSHGNDPGLAANILASPGKAPASVWMSRAGVLHSPVAGPGAACHCCQTHEPPDSSKGGPRAPHAQHPETRLGAAQLRRGCEQEHREATQRRTVQSMGRGMTHSTFLRETFWLGRVAETVM